jgi:hypothetical protein
MANSAPSTDVLAQLGRQVEADHAAVARRERVRIVVLFVLVLAVCGYMGWLYRTISRDLTPETLCEIATVRIIESLPAYRKMVADEAIKRSDEVVNDLAKMVLDAPKQVRMSVEEPIMQTVAEQMKNFESQLLKEASAGLKKQIDLVQQAGEGRSAQEKVEDLLRVILHQFQSSATEMADKMYPEYSKPMQKLNTYLTRLKTARDLTAEERTHKEIVQITLLLLPEIRQEFLKQAEALRKYMRPVAP